jgi:hypothetical protein
MVLVDWLGLDFGFDAAFAFVRLHALQVVTHVHVTVAHLPTHAQFFRYLDRVDQLLVYQVLVEPAINLFDFFNLLFIMEDETLLLLQKVEAVALAVLSSVVEVASPRLILGAHLLLGGIVVNYEKGVVACQRQ